MNEQYREFGTRLKKIDQRHRKLADGYVSAISQDGLIVAVPRRRRLRVPFAGLAMVALGIIAFKGIVHAHLGPTSYDARVERLAAGTGVEQAAAWIMQADPLTLWAADQVRALLP